MKGTVFRKLVTRGIAAAGLAVVLVLALPVPSEATITGGCAAVGTGSQSGSVDLASETEWHVKLAESLSGQGASPLAPTKVTVQVMSFGIGVPLVSAQGNLGTNGSAGPYPVVDLARYLRVVTVAGGTDTCAGTIRLVIDDAGIPLAEALGAVLTVVGVLGMLASGFMCSHLAGRIAGSVAGLLGGGGVGMVLQQAGIMDPSSLLDLAVPAGGLVAGILVASCCCPKAAAASNSLVGGHLSGGAP